MDKNSYPYYVQSYDQFNCPNEINKYHGTCFHLPMGSMAANNRKDCAGPRTAGYFPPVPAGNYPNQLLLTPAIFGGSAAFILGFSFYGHSLSGNCSKLIFFLNVFSGIVTLGVGAYIYQLLHIEPLDARFKDIFLPLLTLILYYAFTYNLIYSLYPGAFSGVIGKSRLTQFISFLAMSIGSISIGETLNVSPENAGIQILVAIEHLFNLFVITLLISILT